MSAESIPAQLRRRREASRRLPGGDPIDSPRGRAEITIRTISQHTTELTGCDWAVAQACTTIGARYQRAPLGGAWLVQSRLIEDVLALLDVRGYRIVMQF